MNEDAERRLKALLAMTVERGCTEAEAILAAAKAAALMQEHIVALRARARLHFLTSAVTGSITCVVTVSVLVFSWPMAGVILGTSGATLGIIVSSLFALHRAHATERFCSLVLGEVGREALATLNEGMQDALTKAAPTEVPSLKRRYLVVRIVTIGQAVLDRIMAIVSAPTKID